MFKFLLISTLLIGIGCIELDDSGNYCENASFDCDCFHSTYRLNLETGLAQACQEAITHLTQCHTDAGPDILQSYGLEKGDLCNGNGLDEYPPGCMSFGQQRELIMILEEQACASDATTTWAVLQSAFSSWKRRELDRDIDQ